MAFVKFRVNVGVPTTFTTKTGFRFPALDGEISIDPAEQPEVLDYLRELQKTTGHVTELKDAPAPIK